MAFAAAFGAALAICLVLDPPHAIAALLVVAVCGLLWLS